MNPDDIKILLKTISDILFWCFIFSFALLLFWFGLYMLGENFVSSIHSPMFGLSKHELDLFMYGWMGTFKILAILFFLFPWIAIKIVLRKK